MGRKKGSLNKKTLARIEAEKKQDEVMKPTDVAIREEIAKELKATESQEVKN